MSDDTMTSPWRPWSAAVSADTEVAPTQQAEVGADSAPDFTAWAACPDDDPTDPDDYHRERRSWQQTWAVVGIVALATVLLGFAVTVMVWTTKRNDESTPWPPPALAAPTTSSPPTVTSTVEAPPPPLPPVPSTVIRVAPTPTVTTSPAPDPKETQDDVFLARVAAAGLTWPVGADRSAKVDSGHWSCEILDRGFSKDYVITELIREDPRRQQSREARYVDISIQTYCPWYR